MTTHTLKAWVAARVVLVECPTNPERPNGVLSPDWGFEDRLLARFPTLKRIEGPLVNGIIALTWEDDPASTEDLVIRSAQMIDEEVRGEYRRVDPPGCGCTDCLLGDSRRAVDHEDYLRHNPEEAR